MKISIVKSNRKQYAALLLLADEQEEMVERYLDRGDMFILRAGKLALAECLVTQEGNGIFEIKSLAVRPEHQRKGLGRKMVEFVKDYYSGPRRMLLLGTGETPRTKRFYESCGFRYSHRLRGFFLDHYDHPIVEEGIRLADMTYFKQRLPTSLCLEKRLATRIHADDLAEIRLLAAASDERLAQLATLLFAPEKRVAENAAWVLSGFTRKELLPLQPQVSQLIDMLVGKTASATLRRLLLTVLMKMKGELSERLDLLDFCLNRISLPEESVGIRALCMKLAYETARFHPELLHELRETLDWMGEETLSPGLAVARRNVMKAINGALGKRSARL